MSAFQPPPCEARPYPHKVASILMPDPWRVTCVDGKAPVELVKSIFGQAFASWHTHMEIEDQ